MKIHQFRCWPSLGANNEYNNIPPEIMFSGNNILDADVNGGKNTYTNVVQLGIQGAPGTHFWLNDAQLSSNPYTLQGITLNWTGIFEIDLSEIGGEINSINFDPNSYSLYLGTQTEDGIEPTNYKLIVDILYDNALGGVE